MSNYYYNQQVVNAGGGSWQARYREDDDWDIEVVGRCPKCGGDIVEMYGEGEVYYECCWCLEIYKQGEFEEV